MFSSRCAAVWAALLLLAGCQRTAAPPSGGLERVAILPFENQTGDARLDWLASGVQHVLLSQLGAWRDTVLTGPLESRAVLESGARVVWHGVITRGPGGRPRVELTREDKATNRLTAEPPLDLPLDNGFFPSLARVAQTIGVNTKPRPYATANPAALEAYATGRFDEAARLDPRYTNAWLRWAERESLAGRKEEALRIATEFRSRVPDLPESENAQFDLVAAEARADANAAALSWKKLAAAEPTNATVQRAAATVFTRLRWAPENVEVHRRLTRIDPDGGDSWNQLAYAQAQAGDLAGARAAVEEYKKRDQSGVDAWDSHAEIEYRFGNFARAASLYEETFQRKPGYLAGAGLGKAAYARLMAGDRPAADALFAKLLAHRKITSPVADVLKANWLFQTGRRKDAFALADAASASPALATEACLMHAAAGAWEQAFAAARRALAAQPTGRALLCAFIAQPAAGVEEWTRRANQAFSTPAQQALRNTALGYALALRGHCPAAMAPLRAVLEAAGVSDDGEPRTLLAHCAIETKQWETMKQVFTNWPQPPPTTSSSRPSFSPS